jgi:hypothetical protein
LIRPSTYHKLYVSDLHSLRPCWKVVLNSRDLIEWNPRRRSQSHVSLRRTEKRTPQSPRFLRPCSKLVLSALCSPSALTNASSELDRSPFDRDGSGNCLRLARVEGPFAAVAVLTRPDPRYLFPPSRPTDCFAIVYPGRALCPSSPRQPWAALFTHRPTDCFANRLPETRPFPRWRWRDAVCEDPFGRSPGRIKLAEPSSDRAMRSHPR